MSKMDDFFNKGNIFTCKHCNETTDKDQIVKVEDWETGDVIGIFMCKNQHRNQVEYERIRRD